MDDSAPVGGSLYTGAGNQTLVFVGDSTLSYYSSLTNAGANQDPAVARFVPKPSPYVGPGGSVVDPTRSFIITGKGGSGKALQNKYLTGGGAQFPRWYVVNAGAPAQDNRIYYVSCQIKIVGTAPLTIDSYLTSKFFQIESGGTGEQFSIKDKWPTEDSFPGYSNGAYTVWQPVGATGVQSDPSGDDASQPIGPYPYQISDYHHFLFARKANTTAVLKDGYMKMWIKGAATSNAWVKVIDISAAGITETPPGALKPYCSTSMVNNSFNADTGVDAAFSLSTGGDDSSVLTEEWSQYINIGDNNPLNRDTFTFWYE